MASANNPLLKTAEAEGLSHSAGLRRELNLFDLVLAQILLVVVPDFFGTAVKAGTAHVVLWLTAVVLFFIPLALIVAHLNRLMPLEGGLYEWARLAFGDRIGFLVAWNLWLFIALYVAVIGLVTATFLAYAAPSLSWMADNRWAVLAASVVLIAAQMILAAIGFHVGKWFNNAGSVAVLITVALLVSHPLVNRHGTVAAFRPLRLVMPPLTVFTLSVFSKMTFGALSGFEYVAIFAGESRSPARNIGRSILITAPVIALIYIFTTSAILAYVSPEAIDVIGPIPQALRRGFGDFGAVIVPIAIFLLLANYLSTFSLYFSGSARLPMAAGWDHLLPAWFSHLHSRYKTPVNSILFLGVATLAASIAALIGVGEQEAYELLLTWGFTFYGVAYLALFAIPIFAPKEKGIRPRLALRVAAGSGLLVTLLFVGLSIFPVIDVTSSWRYSVKIAAVVLGANFLGWMIYRAGRPGPQRS
ncbi:MAG TPA: APC family permease [Candidatus Sulfotelmatobacter sp.]|nr:APC family permease [Candidatus Sulfotelmatobacter sp.]